ncbi:MAG: hypothetical protein RLZ07_1511 [Pseudomonadota bacterium]
MTKPLLTVRDLTMRFGGLVAVDKFSFEAQSGHITAIIGPNGAGKTTAFNCITGFYKPSEGSVTLHHPARGDFSLEKMEDHNISRVAKVARTFQNIRLFGGMTVLENLMIAQHNELMRASMFSIAGIFGMPSYRRAEREAIDKSMAWLERIGIADKADEPAAALPYGQQRKLEIVRALCTDPVLLCLDEPAAGLNPKESDDLGVFLRQIRDDFHVGILLIEHDMSVVMEISDHIVVLEYGRKISDGTPAHVRNDAAVIKAYLGVDE